MGDQKSDKPRIALKERVSKTGRLMWSGLGVLATIGGVFGLYQTLLKPAPAPANTAEDVIVAMVESKVIDIEEAGRIVSSLSGGSSDSTVSAGAVQDVAKNGTDAQREGLRLLREKHTRDQGISILEAEAKTSDDWQLLAGLYGSDKSEEALSAIKKSIALDPENFKSISLLASFQAARGDFSDARRSALTAQMLAGDAEQKLLSARGFLKIVTMARDLDRVTEKQVDLLDALRVYKTENAPTVIAESIGFGLYKDQPNWLIGLSHAELSNAYVTRLRGEKEENKDIRNELVADIIKQSGEAIAAYEPLLPAIDRDDRFSIINAISQAKSLIAFAHFTNDEFDKGVEITKDVLDMVRDEAETGDRRAIEALPRLYQNYSAYLLNNGDKAESLKAMRRSTDLQISYAKKYEDENLDVKISGLNLNYDIMEAATTSDTSKIDESLDEYMTMAESYLEQNPDTDGSKDKVLRGYLKNISSVASFYMTDRFGVRSETKALHPIERADKFNQQMIKNHGENHDRIHYGYYYILLKGDVHAQLENKDKALNYYQKALELSPNIPPKEDEKFVVQQSQLECYFRIASLELEPSNDAVIQGLKVARELDDANQLQTQYQGFFYQLSRMAMERGLEKPN